MHASRTAASDVSLPPGSGPVILLVEDYPDCRELYAASLTLAGFRVLEARDGQEALTLALRLVPDLVLMDLCLPVMDGFEATRRLKADPATSEVPVIALTAHPLLEPGRLQASGFDDVIAKPCLPDELTERIRRVVSGGAASSPASS